MNSHIVARIARLVCASAVVVSCIGTVSGLAAVAPAGAAASSIAAPSNTPWG